MQDHDLRHEADHREVLSVGELEVIEDARSQPPGADDLAANVRTLRAATATNATVPAPACIRDRIASDAEPFEVPNEPARELARR